MIDKLKNRFRREAGGEKNARDRIQGAVQGGQVYGDLRKQGDMQVSTVYRCVRFLSESVANLSLRTMRLTPGGIWRKSMDSPLDWLLNVQPNPDTNAFDFWRLMEMQVLLLGNAYIVIIRNPLTREIDQLRLVNAHCASYNVREHTYHVTDTLQGINKTFRAEEVIHIKGPSLNGYTGLSVIEYARTAIDTTKAGDQETQKRFRKGGNIRGIISNDYSVTGFNEVSDEELEKLASQMNQTVEVGDGIMPMPGDVKFSQLSLSSADLQFLETRKFGVLEICRFFGVHPSFVFSDTSNNYKSAEMANVAFLSNTLNPMLRQIENELRVKLFGEGAGERMRIEFDRSGLYACDLETRVKWQSARIAAGLATINEARLEEGLPPVEDGDKVLVTANVKTLSTLVNEGPEYQPEESKHEE